MRMRIASIVAVLVALGSATFTMARPQGEPPGVEERATPKPQLRAQVARLRAEVEVLQLEHEGDFAVLKDLINGVWMAEANASMDTIATPMLEGLRETIGANAGGGFAFPKEVLARAGISFNPKEEARNQAVVDKESAKLLRKMYDQMKESFVDKSAALNGKKFELEDLERRLNAIR